MYRDDTADETKDADRDHYWTRTMPAGHGGTEGKRCAQLVDERGRNSEKSLVRQNPRDSYWYRECEKVSPHGISKKIYFKMFRVFSFFHKKRSTQCFQLDCPQSHCITGSGYDDFRLARSDLLQIGFERKEMCPTCSRVITMTENHSNTHQNALQTRFWVILC